MGQNSCWSCGWDSVLSLPGWVQPWSGTTIPQSLVGCDKDGADDDGGDGKDNHCEGDGGDGKDDEDADCDCVSIILWW